MSKSSNNKCITRLLFVFVVSVALVSADLVVLAQNENTQDEPTRGGQMTSNTQTGNMSGNTGNTGGRRRRGRRRASGNTNAGGGANVSGDMSGNASMTADQGGNMNAGATVTTGGRRRRRRRSAGAGAAVTTGGAMTPDVAAQLLVNANFTGTVDYEEGGLKGPATLTFSGTPASGFAFTITPTEGGGNPVSGRATIVVTNGYVAVAMMFGDLTPPGPGQSPPPLPAVSLRGRGLHTNRATLMTVPGEKRKFSFISTRGTIGGTASTGGRRRRRRSRNRMSNLGGAGATTTGGETNSNATTPPQ